MLINGRAAATAAAAEDSKQLKERKIVEGKNKSFHLAEDRQADFPNILFFISTLDKNVSGNLIWKITISGYCDLWYAEAQKNTTFAAPQCLIQAIPGGLDPQALFNATVL